MNQKATIPSGLPELPLDAWERTKQTLHLYLQIVGKVRLQLATRRNHWWNVTLYLRPYGLSTGPIPFAEGFHSFEINFNFLDHRLDLVASSGYHGSIQLSDGLSVPRFYEQLCALLEEAGLAVQINDRPFDVPGIEQPFSRLDEFSSYQREYVERFWRILIWVDGVFQEFSGRFYGKTCPVHLYWHHMDLAVTRFSGRRAPALPPEKSTVEKDAYSHEVISFGFWAGDEQVRAPAFYAYAHPSPEGLAEMKLTPAAARWVDNNGSPTAMLFYDELRAEKDPRAVLLSFLESTYRAAAQLADWPAGELAVPPLSRL
jgi:hypothetical protein